MLITRDDIQRIGNEETLMHFLQEKLNLPISEGATLAQIALPLPLSFLRLDSTVAEYIIDCQDFSGLPQDALGERRPFLIRFRREPGSSEILREVAESLAKRNINPAEVCFICADENFQPFAFAYFNHSTSADWYTALLTVFSWTRKNTRINTGSEHDLSAVFPSRKTNDSDRSKTLLTKLQKTGKSLGDDVDIHSGIYVGYKLAFVIDEHTRERLLTKDPNSAKLIEQFPESLKVHRKWRWKSSNVIYIPNSKNRTWPWSGKSNQSDAEQIFKAAYPAISAYIRNYKDELKKASNPFYWEFHAFGLFPKLERPKIIYSSIAKSMQAAYDTSHRFLTTATHFIPTTDLSLLAILNSKLFNWYAHKKFRSPKPKIKQLFFAKKNMVKAPIAARTKEQKAALSSLVQQILNNPDSPKVPNIEKKIDALVYKLYDLSAAEIALIEEESNQ